MFIDQEKKSENSKKLTLNPIRKKQMTLTPQKFKDQKDKFFKDACNKELPGRQRLWSLRKLKLLVDRREKVLCANKGKPYDDEEDGLDVSEMEESIKKHINEEQEGNRGTI